jgi:hypothetical protein
VEKAHANAGGPTDKKKSYKDIMKIRGSANKVDQAK